MSEMKCPNCISPYLTESFDSQGKVHLDRCPKCKGIWFDHKELEKLFAAASKDLTVQPDARELGLICPHCGKSLLTFSYPQTLVKVDMCRKCKGIWLDMGELMYIVVLAAVSIKGIKSI